MKEEIQKLEGVKTIRPPQGVSVELGVTRVGQGPRGRIRSLTTPPSQTASADSLMMRPPSTPVTFGLLDIRPRKGALRHRERHVQ